MNYYWLNWTPDPQSVSSPLSTEEPPSESQPKPSDEAIAPTTDCEDTASYHASGVANPAGSQIDEAHMEDYSQKL
jgi:hypothetical protein